MTDISIFDSVDSIDNSESMPLSLYLHEVQTGRWQDQVLQVRAISDKKRRDALKKSLPGVTFSGLFSKRKDDCLIQHSGIICIDLDDLGEDTEAYKDILSKDRYVYSCFTSVSGTGLRVLFKIAGTKHRESYYGISDYLRKNYGLVTDPQSMVPSRSFYVTYDPYLYVAGHNVPMFVDYPKEQKNLKVENFAFAEDDFFNIIQQIEQRNINLCDGYQEWLKIGFAFASKFGETGRTYFHIVSQISDKYNERQCDKQYTYCLKHKSMNVATIATFYYYAKQAGLQITSERTQIIRKLTVTGKSAGLRKEQIVANLKKQGIENVDDVVGDVFDRSIGVGADDSLVDQLEAYIANNYILKRNIITRKIERFPEVKPLEQVDLNSMYLAAKKVMKAIDYQLFDRIILSDFVQPYNPLQDYFNKIEEWKNVKLSPFAQNNSLFKSPTIDKLASAIKNANPGWTNFFLRKWIVGVVSGAFYIHNPLVLVLTGKQNTGKTYWFRNLLPSDLQKYYAESKLMAGKDDEILLCQKLIVMDDEFSGKGRREEDRFKEITSKQTFSLREPYGRTNTELTRIATLCGTTNDLDVMSDPTGNRRIIPIKIIEVDRHAYNNIDKTELWKEAYQLLNNGFDWRIISSDDITFLNESGVDSTKVSIEEELIMKMFEPGDSDYITTTDIFTTIEKETVSRLNIDRVTKSLRKLGFEQMKKWDTNRKYMARLWGVNRRNYVRPIQSPPNTF